MMEASTDLSIIRIPVQTADLQPAPETVARYLGGTDYQVPPKSSARIHEGIEQAMAMIDPLAEYRVVSKDLFHVEAAAGRMEAFDDSSLPLMQLSNRYFAVYLATLGPNLEVTCRKLADRNRMYQAMLLDAVGTAMLDALGRIVEQVVASKAQRLGLHANCRLGPGLNGMSLESQALLFHLLDRHTTGVQLNSSYVMMPTKSISAFVLFSESERNGADSDKCSRCNLMGCLFRAKQ